MNAELRRVVIPAGLAAFSALFIAGVASWAFGDTGTVGMRPRLVIAAVAIVAFVVTFVAQWWLLGRPVLTECRDRATTGDKVVSGINAMVTPAGILSVNLAVAFNWFSGALFLVLSVVTFLSGYYRFDKEQWPMRWFKR